MCTKCLDSRLPFMIGFLVLLLTAFGPQSNGQGNTDTAFHTGDSSPWTGKAGHTANSEPGGPDEDLLSMSLEELLNLEVTSVSKKKEKWSDSAAAIYVVTAEDIRRSGAQTLPEALRMVPGVNVASLFSMSSGDHIVGTRGFNRVYSNKLLVLIDGRSIYTPIFAGVYWNAYQLPGDIDRIEVIRGPGAALWGANAVNGIINIVTKSARDTQGVEISGGGGKAGKLHQSHDSIRYGGKLGEDTWYRVYGQYHFRDRYDMNEPRAVQSYSSGLRLDRQATDEDLFTLQTDWSRTEMNSQVVLYDQATLSPFLGTSFDTTGLTGNVLARWNRRLGEDSEMTTQFYYDRFEWNNIVFENMVDTLDLDFQHSLRLNEQHRFIWGLGYRYMNDQIGWREDALVPKYEFDPQRRGYHLVSAFIHDEIELVQDTLRLTVGSKFEHNDFSGFEVQPNARLLYKPHEDHVFWASVSRAVRTPSRSDHSVQVNTVFDAGGIPGIFRILGNDDVDSEELMAYELGYRTHPHDDVFVDVTAFYNDYDQLMTAVPSGMEVAMTPTPHVNVYNTIMNQMKANSCGMEIAVNWQIANWWKLAGAYSYLRMQVSGQNRDVAVLFDSDDSVPYNQLNLRSNMNLPHGWEFDTMAYYADNVGFNEIPHYIRLDARLGWHINENLELSIVGRNLADSWHPEYDHAQEIPCGFYSQLTVRF